MINRRSFIAVGFISILLMIGITLLAFRDQSLERIRQADTIRIGYAVEAPFAFLLPGDLVTGESPELARAIVQRLGITHITWVQTDFDRLIPELEEGRFDVIAAGMFITPIRAEHVAFSQPTFHVEQSLLVQVGNPYGLHSYGQAASMPAVRIIVLDGSVEAYILQQSGIAADRLMITSEIRTGWVAVQSGLADGLALSAPTLRWIVEHNQLTTLELAEPFVQPASALTNRLGYGAFAFRLQDRQLRVAWNDAMRTLIGSPEHLRIIEPFGFTSADLPGSITTEEVLAP